MRVRRWEAHSATCMLRAPHVTFNDEYVSNANTYFLLLSICLIVLLDLKSLILLRVC